MPSEVLNETPPVARRVPRQERSRRRVEQILDAAAGLVQTEGAGAVSTRSVAEAAGVPIASLYQYFADRDALLLALVERDMAEMDAQVLADLAVLSDATVAGLVEATMRAFVKVYARRPAFVEVWLRGRGNEAVRRRGREHNGALAAMLLEHASAEGLAPPGLSSTVALLAVEVGDRVFQLAYEHDAAGDPELIEEGITMVTAYLQHHVTGTSR